MNSQYQSQLFSMYKFEHSNIILMQNLTRKLYAYSDIERSIISENYHQIILLAFPLCSGLVYEKQLTSLRKQVQPRIDAKNKDYFGQEQLNNTFQPIFDFLLSEVEYGGMSLDSILVDNQGKIRLKDPRLTKKSKWDDWESLGLLMIQCALLINDDKLLKIQKSKESLVSYLENYSTQFAAKIWILLNNVKKLVWELNQTQKREKSKQYMQLIEELEKLRNKKQDRKQNISNDSKQNSLQIKFHKAKKPQIIKLQSSIKKKIASNENQNQKQQKNKDKEALEKLFNDKISLNKESPGELVGTKIKKLNLLQIQPAQLIIRAKKSSKQFTQSSR